MGNCRYGMREWRGRMGFRARGRRMSFPWMLGVGSGDIVRKECGGAQYKTKTI